jgi:hypothetical protein
VMRLVTTVVYPSNSAPRACPFGVSLFRGIGCGCACLGLCKWMMGAWRKCAEPAGLHLPPPCQSPGPALAVAASCRTKVVQQPLFLDWKPSLTINTGLPWREITRSCLLTGSSRT